MITSFGNRSRNTSTFRSAMNTMPFWSAHTHSIFSAKDALPTPRHVVDRAVELGYPALGLTDHGTLGGIAQMYKAAKQAGIEPLPGVEAYVSFDRNVPRPSTMHLGILATSEAGYRNLVSLVNASQRNFKYKPIIDLADLATAAEDGLTKGLAVMTGCWFGLAPTLMRSEGELTGVRNVVSALAGWFGSGCYVEIQNHLIDAHDDIRLSIELQAVADSLGLPTIITQDSHYCHENDRAAHETMKRLVSWSDDPDDAVFPGDGYHMVDTEWMEDHHPQRVFDSGMAGLADLLGKAKVRIRELDTFKAAIPNVTPSKNPDDELTRVVKARLKEMLFFGEIKKPKARLYSKRVDAELKVLATAGFSGYLLFTAKVCEWIRSQGITYNIRGSASGSLLCYLAGITRLDPIVWGLPFERFLTTDQQSMPDIDIDVEDRRRDKVMEMLADQYTTFRIGTWSTLGLSKADEEKGSLIVRWRQQRRRTGADPLADIPEDEMQSLRVLSQHAPYVGMGVHPAGIVVAPDESSTSGLPVQWVASSKTMVTAFPMKDVEAMGLVKLDVLGVKTLTGLSIAQDSTGIDPWSVPMNDKRVFQMLSKGDVDGIFQLEGPASARGIRKIKVKKMADIIAAVALFRPAAMSSGATEAYIARKSGLEPIIERHPVIMEQTKETYGVMLFQEQAMDVMRNFGLPLEFIEKARKAIKASNKGVGDAEAVMADVIAEVEKAATDLTETDRVWLEAALKEFAGYSFNKAHATSYGIVAYITGWFKINYPVAFWVGQLVAYTGDDQEITYLAAARKQGIDIRPPHVNLSSVGYTAIVKSNAIRKGLTTVKGVGIKVAEELVSHAPYESLEDLAKRVNARRVTGAANLRKGHSPDACGGIIAALSAAGAFKDINPTKESAV